MFLYRLPYRNLALLATSLLGEKASAVPNLTVAVSALPHSALAEGTSGQAFVHRARCFESDRFIHHKILLIKNA
ncbi:hypothetical protein T10_7130 [Trichinella papuae]|uniref:Uncharacterized protein n=1 Tax=Trichinella papuae TaxID=268474 RepID=A0A0V1M4K4_9BILA|nr:hypothetical protein T10_7130 [Trichinella papuae]